MKISKIQINGFGNIHEKNIEFSDGINLIHGNNEAGKSTLIYFIKSIFYGVNKNKNGNTFSEQEHFKPWQGYDFSGKIDYTVDNRRYSAYRDFNRNNCKVFDESGNDITSEFSKDKSRGTEIGYTHFGMDEETFLNTVFVSQGSSKVEAEGRASVIQKLTNIIQSGQESMSYDKTKERLHKILLDEVGTDRTRNKPINNVIHEIEAYEKTRDELIYNREKKELITEKEKSLSKELEAKEKKIGDVQKVFELKEKYARLTSEREKEYEISLKVLEKEKEEREKHSKRIRSELDSIVIIACFLISLVLAYYHLYMGVLIPLIAAIIGVIIIHSAFSKHIELLPPQNIESIKENLKRKEVKELEALCKQGIPKEYTEKRLMELKSLLTDLEKQKENILLEKHKLKIEYDNISKHLERLNDVEEQLCDLYEKEEAIRKLEYSIKLADQALDSAYEELKSDFIPHIEKAIKENIQRTTNGKYQNAIYNDRLGILFENDVGAVVPVAKMSQGTIDQAYLGFRLAMSEEMGNIPIFLDETFAYYDDERLKNILQSLAHKKVDAQVFIMTCTDRESRILNELKIQYHQIEL